MKRFLGILVSALIFNSCDDGNLILETIDFEDATTLSCTTNDIIYKLNEKEALLIEISKDVFPSEPTTKTVIIGNNIKVYYRFYNGKVTSENICNTVPPLTPVAINQWIASSGEIEITTTTVKSTNTTDNSTRITAYNHRLVFKNITFLKSDGNSQTEQTMVFGDYQTAFDNLPVLFTKTLNKCSTNTPNLIYDSNSSESLTLNIDPTLIASAATALNTPRTGLISSTTNKVTYRTYSGLLTPSYFCNAVNPTTPLIEQEWNAVAGVAGVSGIVEVTTVSNGTGFKHTIKLKKVTLKKGKLDFSLGDSYLYGDLLTN